MSKGSGEGVNAQSQAADSGGKSGESFAQRFGSDGGEGIGASNGRGGTQNVRTITRSFDGNLHNLARNLKENAQPEIVRQARFIFRSESSGEIRLVLKPESLGQVRIQLQLQDNHIAGRIIVENSNVRDAFEQNMQDLERAFREHGMETGDLEVSVGQQHQKGDEGQGGKNGRASRTASLLEQSVPILEEIQDERGVVNLYA